MSRLILLDTTILGLLCSNPTKPGVRPCYEWLRIQGRIGDRVMICDLNDFEIRRELIRLGATAKIERLEALHLILEVVPVKRQA